MKKIIALVAVLFSVVVPVQSQAVETKSLVIIDSYFQSSVAQNPITSTGAACAQSKPIANAKASDPYNHGTAMYAVAKLQNPSISIIPICAANAQSDVFPSQLISSLNWVKSNRDKVKAVSISLTFNKTSLECTPFGPVNTPKARLADDVVIRSLINDLESYGIPVFAAAGNDTNKSVSYPGCIANTLAVAHADEKGNAISRFDANTDYFARLSLDGTKWVYNTIFGPVSQTSSSATAAVASMWVTANTPKGIVNPIS